jgi:sporulation protein YabP
MENQKENFSTAISLKKRTELAVSGVSDIISSDENAICLGTPDGLLYVEGEGLRIISMNVSGGDIAVTGKVQSLAFSDKSTAQKSGFFARMFK